MPKIRKPANEIRVRKGIKKQTKQNTHTHTHIYILNFSVSECAKFCVGILAANKNTFFINCSGFGSNQRPCLKRLVTEQVLAFPGLACNANFISCFSRCQLCRCWYSPLYWEKGHRKALKVATIGLSWCQKFRQVRIKQNWFP